MSRFIFILTLVFPFAVAAQNAETESMAVLMKAACRNEKYDSTILFAKQLRQRDRKAAKENRVDFYLTKSYLETGKLKQAKRHARKIFRKPAVWGISREMNSKLMEKRHTRSLFYEYYFEKGNKQKAVKYLTKSVRKKQHFGCGTGRLGWYRNQYESIISCYTDLGKTRKAEKYQKKLNAL